MVIHQDNFQELTDLDPVLTEIFWEGYNTRRSALWSLVSRRPMSASKITDLKIGSFSDPVPFVGKIQYDTPRKDFDIEYIPVQYGKGFAVTQFMLDTLQYDTIWDSASALGTAFMRLEDKTLAGVLNNSTSVLGYDGKALVANDHPRSSTDSTAIDNLLGASLSDTNLNTAINQLEGLGTNNSSETENGSKANVLIYGRGVRKVALELIDSELNPLTANNATNVFNGGEMGLTGLYEPRLTGNQWYVVDSMMLRRYLKWYDLTLLRLAAEEDFDTLSRKYRGDSAFVVGWSDFRWIVGGSTS